MANNFQWFKFSPSDWMMGRIMRCSDVAQARFIRVCCLYWNKDGELSREDAQVELQDSWDELVRYKIIHLDKGFVTISFLDEQLENKEAVSKKRSENAKKRWKKGKKDDASAMQVHASAMQVHASAMPLHTSAMQVYAEERRGEEKRREKNRVSKARPRDPDQICEYFKEIGLNGISKSESEKFWDHYSSNGWKVGKNSMKDWKAACRNWKKNIDPAKYQHSNKPKMPWV